MTDRPSAPGPAPETRSKSRTVVLLPNAGRPLFPQGVAPFYVTDREATQSALNQHDAIIGVVQVTDPTSETVRTLSDIHAVGVSAEIVKVLDKDKPEEEEHAPLEALLESGMHPDTDSIHLVLRGRHRFVVEELLQTEPYLLARVRYPDDQLDPGDSEIRALALALMAELRHLVKKSPLFNREAGVFTSPVPPEDAGRLADMAAGLTSASRDQIQQVLAEFDVKARLTLAVLMVKDELQLVGLQRQLNQQIEKKVTRNQHEFFLREQLKVIKKELGIESDPKSIEIRRLKTRLEAIHPSEEASTVIQEEMDKLRLIETSSPEFNVTRTYLDWLTGLPWGLKDRENLDLARARKILDEDHHGLADLKERIIEYLAVHKLKGGELRGSILCLVGPPGVGKTSMGKSIARTMGRKFFRFSLGGMKDEAEIKGHRRTYVGAMPGKIIQALKRVERSNPVIMLDEIDKLSSSFHGDPSSALLEVLDPEQNHQFLDHYLDVRFNLSDVFFIATANVVDTIPRPLLDRMEVIRLPGYIESEKVVIARQHLFPKQMKEHGLSKQHLSIAPGGYRAIARGWARDAGMRRMEQQIAKICRKAATRLATRGRAYKPLRLTNEADIKALIGEPIYREEELSRRGRSGVAMGLAWTAGGGAMLEVEAIAIPGKQTGLKQTGQLGGVMVESSSIAYSYVASRAAAFDIPQAFFKDHLVHLHVPAGATPKDGPSAGITMGCAILSLASGRPSKRRLAMTGELTLTGRVLPVGGIKEKLIAAQRLGIREVILPRGNDRDLKELDKIITRGITFHLVERFDEVARLAIPGLLQ